MEEDIWMVKKKKKKKKKRWGEGDGKENKVKKKRRRKINSYLAGFEPARAEPNRLLVYT